MSVIKAENLTKVYTETAVPVHALNGVTLNVEEGEFTAISDLRDVVKPPYLISWVDSTILQKER